MEQLTVRQSILIPTSRERVWQAITEPEQIAQWLLPPALGAQLKLSAGGELHMDMFGMEVPLATLEIIEPSQRVTTYGLPDRLIATTYVLGEEDGGTCVTVTMTGFEALPENARQDRLGPSGAAWEKGLANLKAYLAGAELPFPQGYVAALFGYRRETKQTFAVERSIWIAAPLERVWQAVTDPVQIERWFSPGTAWQLTTLEVGGRLFIPDPETGAEKHTQVIERLEPPYRFVIRSLLEPSGASEVTTHTLVEENGGTRLTITNSGYETKEESVRWGAMEQSAFGYGMMLQNTKAYLEGEALPYPSGF